MKTLRCVYVERSEILRFAQNDMSRVNALTINVTLECDRLHGAISIFIRFPLVLRVLLW